MKNAQQEVYFPTKLRNLRLLYCRVGEWPEGLPAHQKKLIQELLK
ncbi:hypothetical protein HPL003_17265 [Paenibacillus terrae HPL-003]|uniref:Uncharacterized protein n=1 Tax=Paenibacillus terrae (strain HPL-003) TaxID=985665 RepID=G7VZA3_PAETH|nr:hypothetical protein HPL003_17265 [Paenibacillus terrae HPL-003]